MRFFRSHNFHKKLENLHFELRTLFRVQVHKFLGNVCRKSTHAFPSYTLVIGNGINKQFNRLSSLIVNFEFIRTNMIRFSVYIKLSYFQAKIVITGERNGIMAIPFEWTFIINRRFNNGRGDESKCKENIQTAHKFQT